MGIAIVGKFVIIDNNYCFYLLATAPLGDAMSMTIAHYFSQREPHPNASSKWQSPPQHLLTLYSQHLFADTNEVRIHHAGEEYRLRLTRNNRLILTK